VVDRKNSRKPKKRQDIGIVSPESLRINYLGGATPMMTGVEVLFTPKPPRRKPDKKTLEILEESAKLVAQNRPDIPLALVYWPQIPKKKAEGYLRTRKSKHRDIYDDLVKKYKTE
jgi:hypothetical protein